MWDKATQPSRKGIPGHRRPKAVLEDLSRLLADAGIVRHRGKIESTINNARRALELRREFGSLAVHAWRHEPAAKTRPKHVTWAALKALMTSNESVASSKA